MVDEWPSDAPRPDPEQAPRLTRWPPRARAWISLAGLVSVAALAATGFALSRGPGAHAPDAGTAPPSAVPRVEVRTVDVMVRPVEEAHAPAPITVTTRSRPSGPTRATPTPVRRAAAGRTSAGAPRRLVRLITGDGRHQVRPFPTVPER